MGRIMACKAMMTGAKLTQEYWTSCYFELVDMGVHFMWGNIRDRATERIIVANAQESYDDEWQEWKGPSASELIDSLPILKTE